MKKFIKLIKEEHAEYLHKIAYSAFYKNFQKRIAKIEIDFLDILRKKPGSKNSLKNIPTIARHLFGLREDARRLPLPIPEFKSEIELINVLLIKVIEVNSQTYYSNQCASYGEALLNCYLDLFITFTTRKTPRSFNVKPLFLKNPQTGSYLEIDIILEEFRLAFEFQGEHHYIDKKVIQKDKFKLTECKKYNRILIPVNPCQLQSTVLQKLILNSIKDQFQLDQLFSNPNMYNSLSLPASNKQLLKFSKVAQRIYLSNVLFSGALSWLDQKSAEYIQKISLRNPNSTSKPAPRLLTYSNDIDIETIYRNLSSVTKLRKEK